MTEDAPFEEWVGYCPICHAPTAFRSYGPWHRDHLICVNCPGYSVPRERALMLMLERLRPDWRDLAIHESSPAPRGISALLRMQGRHYSTSQFFPDAVPGAYRDGVRCEDLEALTFSDESLDVLLTQDVMEHVFNPEAVYREAYRVLRAGGLYLHTTPVSQNMAVSKRAAQKMPGGEVEHLLPAEYHGNPIDDAGSLVTFYWGLDLPDLIASWAPFSVQMTRFNDRQHGILGEMTEVIACEKVGST